MTDGMLPRAPLEAYTASDLSTRRSTAGQVETLLLDQTPVIFGYFYNYLTATERGVTGVYPIAIGHVFPYDAAKSQSLTSPHGVEYGGAEREGSRDGD